MTKDDFERDLSRLLNRYSKEGASNTPDFLLARFLLGCLTVWNDTSQQRESWYGREPQTIPLVTFPQQAQEICEEVGNLPRSAGETEGGGRRTEEPLKCCYLRPSPNLPHGDYRRPCTADAEWVILEQGAPPYEETYACDVHLPRLLTVVNGHKYNRHSDVFTVYPIGGALPEIDPADGEVDYEIGYIVDPDDYDPLERFYTPDDEEDAFGLFDEEDDLAKPHDPAMHEEHEHVLFDPFDPVNMKEPWRSRFERLEHLKQRKEKEQDHTTERNDPDFDVDKEFAEMLKRWDAERFMRPAPLPKDYFSPDKFGEHLGHGPIVVKDFETPEPAPRTHVFYPAEGGYFRSQLGRYAISGLTDEEKETLRTGAFAGLDIHTGEARPLPPGGMWCRSGDNLFKIVIVRGKWYYIPVSEELDRELTEVD